LDLNVRADKLTPLFPDELAECLKPYVCEIEPPEETTVEVPNGTEVSAGQPPNGQNGSRAAGKNGNQPESLIPDEPRPCPVRVYYQRPDISGWLRLGEGWRVLPDQDLIHSLSQLCGSDSVTITYK
jgi:DNA polymerase-3 subunit alpha